MRSALVPGLVVLGLAVLSLTPASPRFLRELDLLGVFAYRLLDGLVDGALSRLSEPSEPPPPPDMETIERGLAAWDDVLRSGASRLAADRVAVIARVVEVEAGGTRFAVDAGPDATFRAGDPVMAGDIAVGLVVRSVRGVAMVETPFAQDARFAGVARSENGIAVRFISVGEGRAARRASVSFPERADERLTVGEEAIAPEVADLLPGSVAVFPAGARIGVIEEDHARAKARGEPAYRVAPILHPGVIDAVAVLVERDADTGLAGGFTSSSARRLHAGMLTPWSDGFGMTGAAAPHGAAVMQGGYLVGFVSSTLAGAMRVRGIGDQRTPLVVLALREGATPSPITVEARGGRRGRFVFRMVTGRQAPAVGDWVVAAGGGRHVPRGAPIGVVVEAEGDGFVVSRPRVAGELSVLRRADFPDPWK